MSMNVWEVITVTTTQFVPTKKVVTVALVIRVILEMAQHAEKVIAQKIFVVSMKNVSHREL